MPIKEVSRCVIQSHSCLRGCLSYARLLLYTTEYLPIPYQGKLPHSYSFNFISTTSIITSCSLSIS